MRTAHKILLSLAGLLIIICSYAATTPTPAAATQVTATLPTAAVPTPSIIPTPPTLDAKAYVLLDANSGLVIASKNSDKRMPPASLTKIMTLYLIASALKQGQINLTDKVRISKEAWEMGGSKMFIRVGTEVPVSLLIQGIIVVSGNDATYAMAQYIGGTEQSFVTMMNQTAAALGMTDTHYTDSNGLPAPNHYSTPMDIAKLARAWILNFPQYYADWFHQKWLTYNHIKQPNRNRLLWRDPSVDGMKTGHTDAAGYCLVASAKRDGMRLISVVMDAPTDSARANDSEALLNYGFRFYESHKLYDANTALATPRVWFGKAKTVPFGLADPLYITIPTGQYKNVNAATVMDEELKAPIIKGKSYGKVVVTLNDKVIATQPLIALQDDQKGGLFSRFFDHISHFLHG